VVLIRRGMDATAKAMEERVPQLLRRALLEGRPGAALWKLWAWVDLNVIDLGRQMRVSYLPPLMVYMAAGISGLTAIVGTFFVKDYLGLSAEFLAMLGFWAGIPWALKMPLGHLVDLAWRWKSLLVFLGAALIAASLGIMLGLLSAPLSMTSYMSVAAWFILSALLSPFGYVVQDVVADAMTVEAVPVVDDAGRPYDEHTIKLMHTTMQTLGRVAIVGGGIAVSLVNILMFRGAGDLTETMKAAVYIDIYTLAMLIPAISVLGVVFAAILKRRTAHKLRRAGVPAKEVARLLNPQEETPSANWWILGGSLIFVVFTLALGLLDVPYNQEIIFAGSMGIVLFLMAKLLNELSPAARHTLLGTAVIIFVFRALPGPGAGATWWEIDVLGFDEPFLAKLAFIGQCLALLGMFIFRRFMAERSIAYVVGFLTIVGTALTLPVIGMYYGLHEWTAALTGGIVDARFIAVVDTALESPLGQVAMIPMLAWIANSAPSQLKATFFAVMASFTNLALSLSTLGTKYLNQFFLVSREVRDQPTGALTVPADYSELGILLITVTVLSLLLPLATIFMIQKSPWRSA
jgi:BT1 family